MDPVLLFARIFDVAKKVFKNHCKKQVRIAWGDHVLFFAMIFEHVFVDAQESLQKTVQDRSRAPRGGRRRRLELVSDLS